MSIFTHPQSRSVKNDSKNTMFKVNNNVSIKPRLQEPCKTPEAFAETENPIRQPHHVYFNQAEFS
ncbi:hypothetical protein B4W72_07350 [Staphylococcus delphini]|uniref:Uncharacterized protein n=1 Tax=Staphylococcus delphini TaxID=53344 RepID=A0A2A4GYU1_9STAP|nr:hypothetical protein B5C08_05340 [Staphylococcus delphini]PCF63621.1 hypothetical protein B5C01_01855 [Staphylococcus delphini]PCF73119.1 hypothetical protein B4W72_07350 [Staphylococcus delphini]